MNTRCHYCGWSFSLSREALEAAVSAAMAVNEKLHVERCPRCRKVIKLPVEQLRRALPTGWSPQAQPEQPTPAREPEPEAVAAAVAAEPDAAQAAEAKPRRRRGSASAKESQPVEPPAFEEKPAGPKKTAAKTKSPSSKTAAEPPAAKKNARNQSKP